MPSRPAAGRASRGTPCAPTTPTPSRPSGGLPVALPHDPDLAAEMLERLDGLVVTGGAFDVSPALYGAADVHPTVTLKDRRTEAELALVQGALERDMPVLGICGGQQLLAVALGGTLIQHIPDTVAGRAGARAAQSAERAGARRQHHAGHAAAPHRGLRHDAGELRAPPGGGHPWAACRHQRRRPGRGGGGGGGPALPLLPRAAMASGIPDRPGRCQDLRAFIAAAS